MEPSNIDKNIAIDLFIFNWTHTSNGLGIIDVVKCGKILAAINAPDAKPIKNSNKEGECAIIETLPLSVREENDRKMMSVNGSVSNWRDVLGVSGKIVS